MHCTVQRNKITTWLKVDKNMGVAKRNEVSGVPHPIPLEETETHEDQMEIGERQEDLERKELAWRKKMEWRSRNGRNNTTGRNCLYWSGWRFMVKRIKSGVWRMSLKNIWMK